MKSLESQRFLDVSGVAPGGNCMRDCGGTMSRAPEMFVCSGVGCAGRGGCRRDECVSHGRAGRLFFGRESSL